MERIWITEVEKKRYKVLTDKLKDNIDIRTAFELLGLSYRHTLRLRDRFKLKLNGSIIRIVSINSLFGQ